MKRKHRYGGGGSNKPPMTSQADVTRVSQAKKHAGPGSAYKMGATSQGDVTMVSKARPC